MRHCELNVKKADHLRVAAEGTASAVSRVKETVDSLLDDLKYTLASKGLGTELYSDIVQNLSVTGIVLINELLQCHVRRSQSIKEVLTNIAVRCDRDKVIGMLLREDPPNIGIGSFLYRMPACGCVEATMTNPSAVSSAFQSQDLRVLGKAEQQRRFSHDLVNGCIDGRSTVKLMSGL